MTVRLRYDGKVFVPETPVDFVVNDIVEASLSLVTIEERRRVMDAALERLLQQGVHGVNLPDEALSRESIYEDRRP